MDIRQSFLCFHDNEKEQKKMTNELFKVSKQLILQYGLDEEHVKGPINEDYFYT